MNRPAPRKSSLAGSSPITPPPAAAPTAVDATRWTQEQHEDADQVEQTRQLQAAERAATKPAPREPKSRAKVSFYQDPGQPQPLAVHPQGRHGRGRAPGSQVQQRAAVPARGSP